jgi:hypothetical protein
MKYVHDDKVLGFYDPDRLRTIDNDRRRDNSTQSTTKMNLDEMFADYCRRTNAKHTPKEIMYVAAHNNVIHSEDGFVVFSHVLDEFHCLFAYAAPGRKFAPINAMLEEYARANGIKCIKFLTDRPEIMGRLFRGYKPVATLMRKELDL